jgi:DNA-binding LacI/PurR family transcriptional regulator
MTVNIKDVAKRAGVSTATVSYVLNGTRGTRPNTRERVLSAIRELGYAQNVGARNLARGRSSLLGMVISDIRNPFFPEVTAAFQDRALFHEMDALIFNTNYDAHRTLSCVRRLMNMQVAGVAILTSQIDPSVIEMLARQQTPAVYLDLGRVDRYVSNIVLDYESGIAQALGYLTQLGHRKIAYIGGPSHLHSAQRRRRAFEESAARANIEPGEMVEADFSVKGGYYACSKVLASSSPTAIVAGNDLTALGVLHRAFDGNLRVPAEFSVVGFDDILISQYTQPALTTVAVPREEIGLVAFEALWSSINDAELAGREYSLSTHLVVRQSAAQVSIQGEYTP